MYNIHYTQTIVIYFPGLVGSGYGTYDLTFTMSSLLQGAFAVCWTLRFSLLMVIRLFSR